MDFNFYMPVKVISGRACFEKGAGELKAMGRRCLIVTGGHSAKISGALDSIKKTLSIQGTDYLIYDKIAPNPLLSACHDAGCTARRFRADFIFGIGGGSSLDAAKAAAVFAANPSLSPKDIYRMDFQKALPIALAGTTAGTGSEVTPVSVLTVDGENMKKSIKHRLCYASVSFVNPAFTVTCPYDLTVSAGLDAVCHAVESLYSPKGGDTSREFAYKALSLLWPALSRLNGSTALPDENSREQLLYGSIWAGLAINITGTAAPHAAGYVLTSNYGLPHGKACAVFLPGHLRRNAKASPALTTKLCCTLGCGINAFCETFEALCGKPAVKMTQQECEGFAGQLEGRQNLSNALVPISIGEISNVYSRLFAS